MVKSKKSAKFEVNGFIKGLRSLLNTLPTEAQKQEINIALNELIRFLADLQNTFQAMPSTEDASQIGESLMRLESWIASVDQIPAIASPVKVGRKTNGQNTSVQPPATVDIDVKVVLTNLADFSVDEIRSQLLDGGYSLQALRAIAAELGVIPNSKSTKKSLADKIANLISNRRMRHGLAGDVNPESLVS